MAEMAEMRSFQLEFIVVLKCLCFWGYASVSPSPNIDVEVMANLLTSI